MISIRVKYHGATNSRGSRWTADDGRGNRYTEQYNYGKNSGKNAKDVAVNLCRKMDWPTELVGGCYKNDYYFNFVEASK